MADPFINEIRMFGINFARRGRSLGDGQPIAISQNSALFSILGTTFGGDGSTAFTLPDLCGRIPVHAGSGQGRVSRPRGPKGERSALAPKPLHRVGEPRPLA